MNGDAGLLRPDAATFMPGKRLRSLATTVFGNPVLLRPVFGDPVLLLPVFGDPVLLLPDPASFMPGKRLRSLVTTVFVDPVLLLPVFGAPVLFLPDPATFLKNLCALALGLRVSCNDNEASGPGSESLTLGASCELAAP